MLTDTIWKMLKATPPAPPITDKAEVDRLYKHWRIRVMYSLFIGYALFYFCRKNISIALPVLAKDLGYSNLQLGLFGSLLYITYGVGKFTNGILGDKANPRSFMTIGIILSAFMNILFGLSSSYWFLAVFWALNGWFQSMGVPPCYRMLANWYSVSEKGFKWGLWHMSHHTGAFIVSLTMGYVMQSFGWRGGFIVPAILCLLTAVFLWNRLRDTPPAMGLPPISEYRNDIELNKDGSTVTEEPESIRQTLFNRVLNNKYVWLIAIMNLFVYLVRYGTFDWATKFLVESKGVPLGKAGATVSILALAGLAAPLIVGYITDKITMGRRGPICAVSFLITIAGMALFYFTPPGHFYLDATALILIGFFVYSPQFLVGVFITDFSSRKAASTAVGFGGVFGYIGAALSGAGTGVLLDRFGWAGGFVFWGLAAFLGAVIATILWNARAATFHRRVNG